MHIHAIAIGHKIATNLPFMSEIVALYKTKSFRGETVCRAEAHLKVKRQQLKYSKHTLYIREKIFNIIFQVIQAKIFTTVRKEWIFIAMRSESQPQRLWRFHFLRSSKYIWLSIYFFWLLIYSWRQASSSSRVIPLCSRTVHPQAK